MPKKALIIGSEGQDGSYLYEDLQKLNYHIIGIDKNVVRNNSPLADIKEAINIDEARQVSELIDRFKPDEIYYLAAFHHSSEDDFSDEAKLFSESFRTNVHSLINVLEGMVKYSKGSRLFYAASSHVFGEPGGDRQDENTSFNPLCIYGITKAAGTNICRFYRKQHGIFCCVGILYNHESPRRPKSFISKKIVSSAVAIKKGTQNKMIAGDLKAKIDWGYAPDYVEAMRMMLQQASPEDYVIATGELHSVGEFIENVFGYLGLDWRQYVEEDVSLIKKRQKKSLCGNSSKIRSLLDWQPKVSFEKMITTLVAEELNNHEKA